MRIRSTKPEFWRSAKVASVGWGARLVLKGLESYVDDNGVGKDDLVLIASDLFSRDLARESTGTLQKVEEAVDELSAAGFIWRYEADGTNLIYLSWWDSTQYINKPAKGRFPRPDGTLGYGDSILGAPFQKSPGDSGKTPAGTGEQGNRGTGEQNSSSEIADANPDAADEPEEAQRLDVERICKRLLDRLAANDVKRAKITKGWRDAARLMLDSDGYTEEQVNFLIDKSAADEFWRSNILSMPKLREKADQLRLKFAPQSVAEGPGSGIRYNPDGTVDESSLPPFEDTGWRPRRGSR